MRDSTSAVSRGDSPRESCSSPSRSTSGWPPSSYTPVSNETRVRVEGLSNTSATLLPSSARERPAVGLQLERAVEQTPELVGRKLLAGQEMTSHTRVLSWNLYHGRDFPPDPALFTLRSRLLRITERNHTHAQVNRPLLDEFARVLDGFDWHVALLQEAPPRWFAELCRRTRSSGVRVLTSRNWLPPLQSALADLNPDLIASSEGGSNQILVRHPGRVVEHRRLTLAWRPEQRRMQWARLELRRASASAWRTCTPRPGCREQAAREVLAAAEAALDWSGPDPLVFGGDLNLRPERRSRPVRDAARALRARRAHGPGRDRPPARSRPRRRRAPAAAGRRAARAARAGRAAHPPLRSPARERGIREIVRALRGSRGRTTWRRAAAGRGSRPRRSGPRRAKAKPKAASSSTRSTASRKAAGKKGGQTTARRTQAKKAASSASRTAASGARGAGVEAKTVAEFRDALRKNLIKPMEMVLLSRDRIEEVLTEAVDQGRVTTRDAQRIASGLVKRGEKQTNDVLGDLESLLETRTAGARKAAKGARGRATRAASPALAQVDRVRRGAGVGSNFPISGYDDLNASQIQSRLRASRRPSCARCATTRSATRTARRS